jgi:hypothetical protein
LALAGAAAALVSACSGVDTSKAQAEFDGGYAVGWKDGCRDYVFGYLGYDRLFYQDREFDLAWCDSLTPSTPPRQGESTLEGWAKSSAGRAHDAGWGTGTYDAVVAAFAVSPAFCYGDGECFDERDALDNLEGDNNPW